MSKKNINVLQRIKTSLFKNRALSLILIFAAILRFWGIYYGYPFFHSDEGMSYHNAIQMIVNGRFAPDVYAYPLLVVYIHIISYLFIFIPLTFISSFFVDTLFDYSSFRIFFEQAIIGQNEINVLYWGRYTNAFLGLISVFLTFLVGKKYFNHFIGLFAAFLLSVNYRHVLASHFSLHDIPNNIFLSLTYLYSLNLLKSNNFKDYIKVGVMAGFLLSVKYSPLGVIPPLVAHLYKIDRTKGKIRWFFLGILIVIFFLLTFSILNFFYFFNFSEWYKYLEYLQIKYNAGTVLFLPYPYYYLFQIGLGPITSILVILGIIISLAKDFKKAFILLSPVIVFFLSLTVFSSGGVYVRNFTLVIPILLIFCAYSIYFIYNLISKKNLLGTIFIYLVVGSLVLQHVYNSVILDYYYSEPWNLSKAKIELSYLRDKKIAGDNWFWDQIFDKNKNLTKVDFNINSNFTFRELQESGAEYVLIDTGATERYFTWWMSINNTSKFLNPRDLINETFPGSVFRELISRREKEFTKPWQAYETNIFLIPIPKISENFEGTLVYKDNFEERNDWIVSGARGTKVNFLKKVVDEKNCIDKNCVWIGPITSTSNQYRIWGTVSYESPVIEVDEDYVYKIKLMLKSDKKTDGIIQDGFFKVELFKNKEDLKNYIKDGVMFVSSRYSNMDAKWQEKEIFAEIPNGYKYLVVRLQSFNNSQNSFYFDNLSIEKSSKKLENSVYRKAFPEDIIFINSII